MGEGGGGGVGGELPYGKVWNAHLKKSFAEAMVSNPQQAWILFISLLALILQCF